MTARIPFKLAFAFLLTWTFVLVYGMRPDRHARNLNAQAASTGHTAPPSPHSGLTLPLHTDSPTEIAHLRVAIDHAPNAGQITDVLERLPGSNHWQVIDEDLSRTLERLEYAVSGEEASRLMLNLLSRSPEPAEHVWETFEDLLDFHVIPSANEGAVLQAGLARMADKAPLERVAGWHGRLVKWETSACNPRDSEAHEKSHIKKRQSALCDRVPELTVQLEPFLVAANLLDASSWRSEIEATARRCAAQTEGLIADALVGEGRWTGTSWHWYGWHVQYNQTLAVLHQGAAAETSAVGPGAQNRYSLAPLEQELAACIERSSKETTRLAPANQELDLVLARLPASTISNTHFADVNPALFD